MLVAVAFVDDSDVAWLVLLVSLAEVLLFVSESSVEVEVLVKSLSEPAALVEALPRFPSGRPLLSESVVEPKSLVNPLTELYID